VIHVRYKELSPGLHGQAESSGRGTVVYLRPGLTERQRSAALRRLRQEASRGCGPALPGTGLRMALAADRFTTGARNTASVVRLHPAGSLVPAALAGLLMALFVLASMSTGVVQLPPPGLSGELFSTGADPTVVGAPAIAQHARNDPASGQHAASGAVSSGNVGIGPQSLVQSSAKVPRPHGRGRHRGWRTVRRDCGPAPAGARGPAGAADGGQTARADGAAGAAQPCGPGS